MHFARDLLIADLRTSLASLGDNGGLISGSVYDTAVAAHAAPALAPLDPALDWLLSQQRPDGGWGDAAAPHSRTVPTLAAVLALHTRGRQPRHERAVGAAVAFLQRHGSQWRGPLPDALPVAVEVILPWLLDQVIALGLPLSHEPYAELMAMSGLWRARLRAFGARAGSPAAHTWETWGRDPDPTLVDAAGSVGNSPAATACWLAAARAASAPTPVVLRAEAYLARAAAATGTGVPGVLPTVYPIACFERAFALHMLQLADLLDHPELQDLLEVQIARLAADMRPDGIGMSAAFTADGDDTAAALSVLAASGYAVNLDPLLAFAHKDHFRAYPFELHASLSVTARASLVLTALGMDAAPAHGFVCAHQQPDGRWLGDKWNTSWLYTTSQAIIALHGTHAQPVHQGLNALARAVMRGGSGQGALTLEETAYAVLGLRWASTRGSLDLTQAEALTFAATGMLERYNPGQEDACRRWLGKEHYRPRRIARIAELAALLVAVEEGRCAHFV